MSLSADTILIITWFVGMGGMAYACRHFFPYWREGVRKKEWRGGWPVKAKVGFGIFLAALAMFFFVGLLDERKTSTREATPPTHQVER